MPALRDRFVQYFRGEPGIRPPFMNVFGPMRETVLCWRQQGMRDNTQWFHDVGFEGAPEKQFGNHVPVNGFLCPAFTPEVVADDGDVRVVRNAWGALERGPSDGSLMPVPFEFAVRDRTTWEAFKERLQADAAGRLPSDWEHQRAELNASELPAFVGGLPCGFLGGPRELFGLAGWVMCFYDDPVLAHDVLDTLCDLWCELFSRVASEVRVDLMFVWEDMCYRNGPLVSPALFREFMLPRYQRLTSRLRDAGIPLMLADTDGNCAELNPLFIEGGIDLVIPFEVQSGMDVREERRKHPTLGLVGGIDKMMPADSAEARDAELAKVRELFRTGRYLPCSDHGVPPNVSYAEYVEFYRRLGEAFR